MHLDKDMVMCTHATGVVMGHMSVWGCEEVREKFSDRDALASKNNV